MKQVKGRGILGVMTERLVRGEETYGNGQQPQVPLAGFQAWGAHVWVEGHAVRLYESGSLPHVVHPAGGAP